MNRENTSDTWTIASIDFLFHNDDLTRSLATLWGL